MASKGTPRTLKGGPKSTPRRLKESPRQPKACHGAPKWAQWRPTGTPRRPMASQKELREDLYTQNSRSTAPVAASICYFCILLYYCMKHKFVDISILIV